MAERGYPTPCTRVLLWSAPRCLSTVFERSIMELKDVKVFHESHHGAFYYGPERRTKRGDVHPERLDTSATFEAADGKLLSEYEGFRAVFAKNHAYFVQGRYQKYTRGLFSKFKHTFLIRHPLKAIQSFYKGCEAISVGFDALSELKPFCAQFEMFKVVQEVDPSPLVLDADDLLENPKGMMQIYCSATGLDYVDSMLSWRPGKVEDWVAVLPYGDEVNVWHGAAMRSSGFIKPKTQVKLSISELPEVVRKAVEDAMPFYEAMYAHRITC